MYLTDRYFLRSLRHKFGSKWHRFRAAPEPVFEAQTASRRQAWKGAENRPCDTGPSRLPPSRQIEIFLMLPRRDLRGVAGLSAGLGIAALDLGGLDAQMIIDEGVTEASAEAGAVVERRKRLGERLRQRLGR